MSTKEQARAEMLNLLYDKYIEGGLSWEKRDNEESFETRIGDMSVHLDKKAVKPRDNYVVWVFRSGNLIDKFDPQSEADASNVPAAFFDYRDLVGAIYKGVEDKDVLSGLADLIERLKYSDE